MEIIKRILKALLFLLVAFLVTIVTVEAQLPPAFPTELDLNLLNQDGSNIDTNLLLTVDYFDSDSNPQSKDSINNSGTGQYGTVFWGIYNGKSNLYNVLAAKGGTDINITVEGYETLVLTAIEGGYISGDYYLTSVPPTINATIDISPDTFRLWTGGKWVTAYIELPEGYNVTDINISTIRLNDTISAEPKFTKIRDYDNDGILELIVRFDRSAVKALLSGKSGEVELTVTGSLTDGAPFKGSDTIFIIEKIKGNP